MTWTAIALFFAGFCCLVLARSNARHARAMQAWMMQLEVTRDSAIEATVDFRRSIEEAIAKNPAKVVKIEGLVEPGHGFLRPTAGEGRDRP